MEIDIVPRAGTCLALPEKPNKVMLLTTDRMFYAGLLGKPTTREFGAMTIYVSLENPFRIQVGGGDWKTSRAQVVPPNAQHRISSPDRLIGMFMIEPETVDLDALPEFLQAGQEIENFPQRCERMRSGLIALMDGRVHVNDIREHYDQFFFEEELPERVLDPRMAIVIEKIHNQPFNNFRADELAGDIRLSVSRFLHLFREEVGTTFRLFRAWKRVRGFLAYVNTQLNLTDIAMETGYPSSSHFSYTVRRYWGLTPKDIIAGSRQLAVIQDSGRFALKGY